MKKKVVIIESNLCKFFTTKQVLTAQLKVDVTTMDVVGGKQLVSQTEECAPDAVIYCPQSGVVDLLDKMKKRNFNKRNTEVTLIHAQDLTDMVSRKVEEFYKTPKSKRVAQAA